MNTNHTKTIFLSVFDGDTERVILRTGVWPTLLASGHRFVLLVRGKDRIDYYREEFGSSQVLVELLPSAASRLETLWYYISWNSIPTHAVTVRRYREYWAQKRYIAFFVTLPLWFLGHLRVWRTALRLFYWYTGEPYADELFEQYAPDLLFAPNMFSPEDMRLLRTAKRRGVRTVTTVKSWDVLVTKAFTRVLADTVLVFNEYNKREATDIGDYAPEKSVVTGFPQFDIYRSSPFSSKEDFCKRLGIKTYSRLILFGVPGDWKSPFSKDILLALDTAIQQGEIGGDVHVIARLHPKYRDSSESLTFKHITLDRPGTYFSKKGEFSIDSSVSNMNQWRFNVEDIEHLADSLYYCDVVINTDSTLTLDAAANNKPTVLVGYDGEHILPRRKSIRYIYERDHYKNVLDTKGVALANSNKELVHFIRCFLNNPVYLQKERQKLKDELLFKIDGKAGERMAQAVLGTLR